MVCIVSGVRFREAYTCMLYPLVFNCRGGGRYVTCAKSASWVDSACLLAAWASASFILLASASWVDSACRLAAYASAFFLLASAFWIDSDCRFIQIGVALRNFAVYVRTPPYQNYGHVSSLRIPGLYNIDRIKWRMIMTLNRKLLEKQRV